MPQRLGIAAWRVLPHGGDRTSVEQLGTQAKPLTRRLRMQDRVATPFEADQ